MRWSRIMIGFAVLVILVMAGVAVGWWLRSRGPARSPSHTKVRAARRAYDGAPPVIPHPALGGPCINCHTATGRPTPGVGIAPANPHLHTPGMSAQSRCQQCHVFVRDAEVKVSNSFAGLPQRMVSGDRLHPLAPPVIPHHLFMREDCNACHSGPAAREEIRCTHPERVRCLQCHARPPVQLQ